MRSPIIKFQRKCLNKVVQMYVILKVHRKSEPETLFPGTAYISPKVQQHTMYFVNNKCKRFYTQYNYFIILQFGKKCG